MKCKHPCVKMANEVKVKPPCPFEPNQKSADNHRIPEDCYDSDGESCEWLE